MARRIAAAGLFLAATTAAAQTTPATITAAEACRQASNAYQSQAATDARVRAGGTLDAATTGAILGEARRLARNCAAKIPNSASPRELTELASLYVYTADEVKAKSLIKAVVGMPTLTESDRAAALVVGTNVAIAFFDPFAGINADAERYVQQLDALTDDVLAQKVRGHQMLLGRYGYADIDDGIRDHAHKLLALAQRAVPAKALWVEERAATEARPATATQPAVPARQGAPAYDGAYDVMVSAYSDLARAAGDFLHADSALMILDEGERVIGSASPTAHETFERQRKMYRLVGTKAMPITGQWWVNEKDGVTLTPGDNKVTLLQFTAHWCVPCKMSYPPMKRMMSHFARKPVEAVMGTYLYGFIDDKRNLTPEQEVAGDRDYYAHHHDLPFKVAIYPALAPGDTTTQDNERRYEVSGIPEIVVVDRKGIIRATVVGWDKGNEQRLTALIDRILEET